MCVGPDPRIRSAHGLTFRYGNSNEIRIDGSPITLQGPYQNIPGNATFIQISGQFTTAGGPVTIEYRISGSGDARAGFSIDDAFLTAAAVVAEPATLLLCGTGLASLGVGFRRRLGR